MNQMYNTYFKRYTDIIYKLVGMYNDGKYVSHNDLFRFVSHSDTIVLMPVHVVEKKEMVQIGQGKNDFELRTIKLLVEYDSYIEISKTEFSNNIDNIARLNNSECFRKNCML